MGAIQETERNVLAVSMILAVVSWLSLVFIVTNLPPVGPNVILFFLALFLAVFHSVTPLALAGFHRFSARASGGSLAWRALRQGGSIALFVTLCAWLQTMRNLNWVTALLLLAVLLAMQVLLEIRR